MNQLTRFGLILGIICLMATLVLAITYEVTKPEIDKKARQEEEEALRAIIPEAGSFEAGSVEGIDYFKALKDGRLVGYCIKITANGYGGFIKIIAGIDPNGIVKGIKVLEHQETPGLGSKIVEVRPGDKEAYFLRQFRGKNAKTLEVKKNIDAITGATISSKAVTDSIRKTVEDFLAKVR